ncbi:MAG TPA: ATPase domain-containing protein, partial [Nitrosopumilaceae archaeon]|nr:ATPase domain-containing protein [Nitrosopumilaceae archaeon]
MPSGNLYLFSSSLGSNADLFAQQILYRNVTDEGKVAYYTVERSSSDVIEDMGLFGMNIEQYVKDGTWVFTRLVVPSMKSLIDAMPKDSPEKKLDLSSLLEFGKN